MASSVSVGLGRFGLVTAPSAVRLRTGLGGWNVVVFNESRLKCILPSGFRLSIRAAVYTKVFVDVNENLRRRVGDGEKDFKLRIVNCESAEMSFAFQYTNSLLSG